MPRFSIARSLKLGSFHIGSSMADLLATAVWNRVLIADLGLPAWPVALLAALRYLLAPLTLWAGHRSDTRPLFGRGRTGYIWLGRGLMLVSLPLLPLSTLLLLQDRVSATGWALAVLSALVYGVGTLISGAPFLALVHDSAPYEQRGQAVSIVQFVLVVSFAFVPALYARFMPVFDVARFGQLVLLGTIGAACFWLFALWGEDRHPSTPAPRAKQPPFAVVFRGLWAEVETRRYAVFSATAAFFAFMQDAVLEPFGGDVFDLAVGETTRFNSYWGTGVLVGMLGAYAITRGRPPHRQGSTTACGLALLALSLALLGYAAAFRSLSLVMPVLVFFGLAFGIFTVGGVSLLMAMSADEHAGAYLALWSVIQLVGRGAGIAAGGALRDVALALGGAYHIAYAAVFGIEALGLVVALVLLRRVDIPGFNAARRQGAQENGFNAKAQRRRGAELEQIRE